MPTVPEPRGSNDTDEFAAAGDDSRFHAQLSGDDPQDVLRHAAPRMREMHWNDPHAEGLQRPGCEQTIQPARNQSKDTVRHVSEPFPHKTKAADTHKGACRRLEKNASAGLGRRRYLCGRYVTNPLALLFLSALSSNGSGCSSLFVNPRLNSLDSAIASTTQFTFSFAHDAS
jgi:hypothetical protein